MNRDEVLREVDRAFSNVSRPETFTDASHCCECAEHDATLRAFDRETIGIEQLGNPGWDPMCFVLPEAFLYYVPAMVRLALVEDSQQSYLDQFLFHMTYDGEKSRYFCHFSGPQRQAILSVFQYIYYQMTGLIEEWQLDGDVEDAIRLWSRLSAEYP